MRVASEAVLRPAEDAEVVGEQVVDEHGCVQFAGGVEVGARYFVVGLVDGSPLEVRARGNLPDDDNSLLVHAPVRPERQKLADGRWQDELVAQGAPRSAAEHPVGDTAEKEPAAKSSGKATTAKPGEAPARKGK